MWLIYFCNALRSSFAATLDPFVTSGFASHSLMPVIAILSSIISASVYMPLAKILNMWDRTIGFSIMIVIATIGMILNASCNSFGVYAAGNVSLFQHSVIRHVASTCYQASPEEEKKNGY